MNSRFLLILSVFLIFSCDNCLFSDCEEDSDTSAPLFEEYFVFETSSTFANYFFQYALIDNQQIEQSDWIGAFHNNICIGTRRWGDCTGEGNAGCDVPVNGYNSGNVLTEDYIQQGEYPSFIIYDSTANQYFNAIPSEEVPFNNLIMPEIDSLSAFSH